MTESNPAQTSALGRVLFSVWPGRILSAISILGLLGSAAGKLRGDAKMTELFAQLGFAEGRMQQIGALELVCGLLYAVPQTRVLGALLVTAYMGGAVAIHVRVGESFVAPVLIGVLVWSGVWLRSPALRNLLPLWRR